MTLAEYVAALTDAKREELREALTLAEKLSSGRCVYSTRTAAERVLKALRNPMKIPTLDRVSSMTSDELAALRKVLP